MKLEYVASGCNFIRLPTPGAYNLPDNLRLIKEVFTALQKVDGKENHAFSIMYNAYCESHFGPAFHTYFRDWVHSVHSDSGGLQMVTLGVTPTAQLRQKVYENQGKNSEVAMSFDEIPIKMVGLRSKRLDTKTRFFDHEHFLLMAKKTGENLAEQLKYFENTNSITKPLIICHGNSIDTYSKWLEIVVSEVPRDLRERIGGIAMAGAAIGNGLLEDIQRAFYFSQLPGSFSHMHLLGVGSVSRLVPALLFSQSGVYSPDLWLSYDSSTHTSGSEQGRYYLDEKTFIFGGGGTRERNSKYDIMHADINKNFPGVFDIDAATFHDALTCGGYAKAEKKYGSTKEAVQTFVIHFASAVANFIRHVNAVAESRPKLLSQVEGVERAALNSLWDVKTIADFKHWEREAGQYIPSSPVKIQPVAIDALF